jgi:hypothetical protein
MPQEEPRAPNPQDDLAKFVRERLENRKYRMIKRSNKDQTYETPAEHPEVPSEWIRA